MNILVDMRVDEAGLRAVRALPGVTVRRVDPPEESVVRPLPADVLDDVQALFCTFPPSNVADARSLRFVQIASAGYAQLVNIGLAERGVRACNALGVFDVPIAEWNLAMMINLLRDQRGLIRNQEQGVWDRDIRFQREIRGMTVGFWGYGGIARETARLAKAFNLTVHVLARGGIKSRAEVYRVPGTGDPGGTLPDQVFPMERKMEFLGGLDFLVLAMPLTDASRGVIGEAELHALRPSAYLLNPARGALVQEQALLRALREGWIAGAALDTHYYYPMPPDHPLWRLPNVIMTPHISGSSGSPFFLRRTWDIFAQNIERLQRNQPLLNELTPEQLKGS
jgi:phosphoglycerate dehydrogenase-like enzyme